MRPARRRHPRPHVQRRRRPRHGPAAPGARRREAELPRLLLRLDARAELRQPVPLAGPRPGHRRRPRPDRLVHRARRARPGPRRSAPASRSADGRRGAPSASSSGCAMRPARTAPSPATRADGSRPWASDCAGTRPPSPTRSPASTFTVTYNDLIAVTLGALYAPSIWPDLALPPRRPGAAALPGGAGAAPGRDPHRARAGRPRRRSSTRTSSRAAPASPAPTASTRGPSRPGSRPPTAPKPAYGHFGRIWNWALSACRSWPGTAGQDRYLGPWTARTSSPVLVVGNHFDPATPYQGAVAASRLLPNSRLLTYAGWGHTAFFIAGNFCVDSHVTRYLLTGGCPRRAPCAGPRAHRSGRRRRRHRARPRPGPACTRRPCRTAVRRALHAR